MCFDGSILSFYLLSYFLRRSLSHFNGLTLTKPTHTQNIFNSNNNRTKNCKGNVKERKKKCRYYIGNIETAVMNKLSDLFVDVQSRLFNIHHYSLTVREENYQCSFNDSKPKKEKKKKKIKTRDERK